MTHKAPAAVFGLQMFMRRQHGGNLRFNGLCQELASSGAEYCGQRIGRHPWMVQRDNTIFRHGVSLLAWRPGGFVTPHDTPPPSLSPSPTLGHSSALLPPYARRSKSLEVLIPALYLKGISTGDFAEALAALLGPDAGGLSASTVARLTEVWADEHAHWLKRDLSARHYVYFWADGIHVQARLEDDAQCLLVIIGATPEGKKELVGLIDGVRESAQSWRELLLDLKRRGLAVAPDLAIADGALGFWKAIEEVWPRTRSQRCWVHKTANVLNKLPKSQHSKAKRALQEIWMAETRNDADSAFDAFIETYAVKYDKAAACLVKDRATMLAFYDFPAEHWKHLRTTNPIESTVATVRHRTVRSKGCLSNKTALAMVFKLAQAAQNSWRRLDGHNQLPKLIVGVKFIDGIEAVRQQPQAAA